MRMKTDNNEIWYGKWISLPLSKRARTEPELGEDGNAAYVPLERMELAPAFQLRKKFIAKGKLKKASLYVTAHGIYKAFIDGVVIGNQELTPGHSSYHNRLMYQIYDVTKLINKEEHVLGFYLADGWWMGHIGFAGDDCQYGNELAIIFQLKLEYEGDNVEWVISDSSVVYQSSGYKYADLFVGEYYDATLRDKDFFLPEYKSDNLLSCKEENYAISNLMKQSKNEITVQKRIEPIKTWNENDSIIFDFGQVLAGKYKIHLDCGKCQKVIIECTEVLNPNGQFEPNIRETYKNQTDIYICSGENDVYEPMFTYHGFRYLRISGIKYKKQIVFIEALSITSKMERTGEFCCSDQRLNRLQENIYNSQCSNMISIPTDCPQREKAGWTGDVQIFAPTACFNSNVYSFFEDWLSDMRFEQKENGEIPIILPYIDGYKRIFEGIFSSAGWGDVCIILPWVLYNEYNEIDILMDNFEMMERWVSYITSCVSNSSERYIWNGVFHFGDWLTPSVSINFETGEVDMMQSAYATKDMVPTMYYYYSCSLLIKICEILGYDKKASYYSQLSGKIKKAFNDKFVDENGVLKSNLQGEHVLAIHFKLLDEESEKIAFARLKSLLEKNSNRLDTGFLSVAFLLDVLHDHGADELLFKVLFNEESPSWLYEVKNGATSIWESWQAIMPDGKVAGLSMNHYAFGCVGDWIYRNIAGINKLAPGYKKILFKPLFNVPLDWAKGMHDTVYGKVICDWKKVDSKNIEVRLAIPEEATGLFEVDNIKSCIVYNTNQEYKAADNERISIPLSAGEYELKLQLL